MEKLDEQIKLNGSVTVKLISSEGMIKQEHTDHNLIVTVGKTYLTTFLTPGNHNTGTEFAQFAGLGTGSSGPSSGDTALGAELSGGGYSRATGTLTNASNVWTNTITFSPGNGTAAITEIGLFSASTSGTMFARQVFAVYNKAAGDTLIIIWNVSFS